MTGQPDPCGASCESAEDATAEDAVTSSDYAAVSLFSGVGGMDLACERAGIKVVATAEIDKHARKILARHFPHAHHYDDVKAVTRDGLLRDVGVVPRVVIGGFPCQDLSVAGRGAGLAGARSGLYFEALRVTQECRAEWVVIENVPGLLSSNGGRDMGTVLGSLADSGYGVAYRVLDAQYFGVPQRRRRVFIVGRLGDDGGAPAEVLALAEGSLGHPAPSRAAGSAPAGAAAHGAGSVGVADVVSTIMGGGNRGYRIGAEEAAGGQLVVARSVALRGRDGGATAELGDDQAFALRAAQGGGSAGYVVTSAYGDVARTLTTNARYDSDSEDFVVTSVLGDIAHTLTSEGADASEDGTERGTPVVTYRKSKRAQTNLDDETWVEDDKTNTINLFDTGDTRATSLIVEPQDGVTVRRLTPLELERLQGFPDDWTAGQADSHRQRQMGNAVAVPCVEWITRRIVALMARSRAAA